MDNLAYVLVNLIPLFLLAFSVAIYLFNEQGNEIATEIFLIDYGACVILFYFSPSEYYFNVLVEILCSALIVITCGFFLYYFWCDCYETIEYTFLLFYTIMNMFYGILDIYIMLRRENFLEIKIIDHLLNGETVVGIFIEIINNEWFKGITIAAAVGVISTLIAEKIKNRKK